MRCFVAIELNDGFRAELGRLAEAGKSRCPTARWVPIERMHLTLRFVGDVPDALAPQLCEAAAGVCRRFSPFELQLAQLGAFPNPTTPRVLWVGVRDALGACAQWAAAFEQRLAPLGIAPEPRPFTPHITLARSVSHESERGLSACCKSLSPTAAAMSVARVAVMESDLRAHAYRVIATIPLQPAASA